MFLSPEIKECIDKSVLCWLATSSEENIPNVSPKEMFTHYQDEFIIVANIASPQTVKNIKQNPNVCISFIEILSVLAFVATLAFLVRRNLLKVPRFHMDEMTGWPKLDGNIILYLDGRRLWLLAFGQLRAFAFGLGRRRSTAFLVFNFLWKEGVEDCELE